MFEKLKKRWNIKNNSQVIIILIVFAITGSLTLYVKRLFFDLLGITPDMHVWIKVPMYIIVILPLYQVMLLIVAFFLGQFRFAWAFEKKVFSRFGARRKIRPMDNNNVDKNETGTDLSGHSPLRPKGNKMELIQNL